MSFIYFLIILLVVGTTWFASPTASLVYFLSLISEVIICAFFSSRSNRKVYTKITIVLFSIGWAYLLSCYLYMAGHGYEWLFSYDTINHFIPVTEEALFNSEGVYSKGINYLFSDVNLVVGREPFSQSYFYTWGFLAYSCGFDIYLGLQLSSLILFPLVGVYLYKIIRIEELSCKPTRSVFLICCCTIVFFYATQIMRDFLVLALYLIAIYLSLKREFSVRNLICLILIIVLTSGIRIESGLFLISSLVVYLYATLNKNQGSVVNMAIIAVAGFLVLLAVQYMPVIISVTSENYENYMGADHGSGIVGSLQAIPILGSFLSILYNAAQPIPFWSKLIVTGKSLYGAEAYNIMAFPLVFASAFNIFTIVVCLSALFSRKYRSKVTLSRHFKLQLLVGFFFLYIQATVISQRRLMPYYCLFYIVALSVYEKLSAKDKKNIWFVTSVVFLGLQFFGLLLM